MRGPEIGTDEKKKERKGARKERKRCVNEIQINQENGKAEQIETNGAECELGVSNAPMSVSFTHLVAIEK